jgi:methionine synthase II (cobalamin-independent)
VNRGPGGCRPRHLSDGQCGSTTQARIAFLWYWLERTRGFGKQKLPHPAAAKARGRDTWALEEAGGVAVEGPIERGPIRMALLYNLAQRNTARPIKACVGAGPVQLSTLAHFHGGPIKDRYQLSYALAEVFKAEIAELVAAGCQYIQLEDLGAWMPYLSGEKDWDWVSDVVNKTLDGCPVATSWHFCMGNAWGNKLEGMTAGGYGAVLPHYYDVKLNAFVWHTVVAGCRWREGPVGVIDVRTSDRHPSRSPAHPGTRSHRAQRVT